MSDVNLVKLTDGGLLAKVKENDTVPVAHGGTGATTAAAAAANILPAQTGNSGKVLTTDGTNISWDVAAGQDVTIVQETGNSTSDVMSQDAVTTELEGKVGATTEVKAGTGLTGGGALSSDVTLSVSYGTDEGTAAQGNDTRIVNGATAYSWGDHAQAGYLTEADIGGEDGFVSAGTGLILTDGEFSVVFGAVENTAAQGNDTRIINGATAYSWGDHASAGYITNADLGDEGGVYTAGTGLSLTDGEFSVSYGTTAGTAVQGNDSRVVNAVQTGDIGVANGVAPLDSNKLIPAAFLPSYVDDVVEYPEEDDLPEEGETGKIYVTTTDNRIWRWTGSTYFEIAASAGSSDTAVRLAAARKINGTDFDGTQDITTSKWGTSRQVTIGTTTKAVDGAADVAWSLAELGAASSATQVTAGTGLTGGGALTSNVTLNVSYGTTSGTAAQGDDSRIVDGATAHSWGNHASAGYVKTDTNTTYSAGTGLTLTGTTFSVKYGTAAGTAKSGDWQPTSSTSAQVLAGSATDVFVTPASYASMIAWNANGTVSSGTLTLNLATALNHTVTISGNVTVGAPLNATAGKTGDLVIIVSGDRTVSWNTAWKFLGTVPDIGKSGEQWVVSYKVMDASNILASASKVA